MNIKSFGEWKDSILFWIATTGSVTCLVLFVSWCSWITSSVLDRPTKLETKQMVENAPFPYLQDRGRIEEKLNSITSTEEKLAEVIERNTTAINDLRIELAKIHTERMSSKNP